MSGATVAGVVAAFAGAAVALIAAALRLIGRELYRHDPSPPGPLDRRDVRLWIKQINAADADIVSEAQR